MQKFHGNSGVDSGFFSWGRGMVYFFLIKRASSRVRKSGLPFRFHQPKEARLSGLFWLQSRNQIQINWFYGIFSVCLQRISSKTSKILFWCQTVQVHRNMGQAILHVPTVVQIIMACCYYNFCFLSFLRRLQIRLSRLRLLDEPKVKINKSVVTDFPPSNPLSSASELITKWDTFLKLNWGFSPFFIFLILISVHC